MSRGRILYIEDNFDNRILIKRVLEAEGYTVLEAANGKTGIEMASTGTPDLILMDINLPDIDGYECTARLRKMNGVSRTPIVALTANVMEGDSQKALDAGCDGYIPKPIDVDNLPVQVATFMNHHDRPAGSVDRPLGSVDRPAGSVDRPASSTDRPASGTDRPAGSIDRPASSTDRPASSTDRPAGSADRPASSNDRPAGSADHPAGSNDHPATNNDRPTGGSDRPAGGSVTKLP